MFHHSPVSQTLSAQPPPRPTAEEFPAFLQDPSCNLLPINPGYHQQHPVPPTACVHHHHKARGPSLLDLDPSYLLSHPRAEPPLLVLDAHQASLGSWRQSTERAGMRPIVIHNKGSLHTTDPADHSKHLAPRARIPTEERARSRRAPLKHLLLSLWPRRTIPLRRSPWSSMLPLQSGLMNTLPPSPGTPMPGLQVMSP